MLARPSGSKSSEQSCGSAATTTGAVSRARASAGFAASSSDANSGKYSRAASATAPSRRGLRPMRSREPAASDEERRRDRERDAGQHRHRESVDARDPLEEVVRVERAHVEEHGLADHAAEQRREHEPQVRPLKKSLRYRRARERALRLHPAEHRALLQAAAGSTARRRAGSPKAGTARASPRPRIPPASSRRASRRSPRATAAVRPIAIAGMKLVCRPRRPGGACSAT